MAANISEPELRVLTYLHEHAKGFDQRFAFLAEDLQRKLGMSEEELDRHTSYLAGHRLVGIYAMDVSRIDEVELRNAHELVDVWITSFGEDYMRELERQPGIARKLTMGVLKELGSVAEEVAVKVLTAHLAGRI